MQWYWEKISHKSYIKSNYTKNPKVMKKRFQRSVYGKPNLSVTQFLSEISTFHWRIFRTKKVLKYYKFIRTYKKIY